MWSSIQLSVNPQSCTSDHGLSLIHLALGLTWGTCANTGSQINYNRQTDRTCTWGDCKAVEMNDMNIKSSFYVRLAVADTDTSRHNLIVCTTGQPEVTLGLSGVNNEWERTRAYRSSCSRPLCRPWCHPAASAGSSRAGCTDGWRCLLAVALQRENTIPDTQC